MLDVKLDGVLRVAQMLIDPPCASSYPIQKNCELDGEALLVTEYVRANCNPHFTLLYFTAHHTVSDFGCTNGGGGFVKVSDSLL